jgi:hypothetical protein
MTNYIPVELLKSPNAVNVLSMIDIVSHIIPQEDPAGFISNINRKRMTRYNIQMLEKNLNTVDSFNDQLKRFYIIKKYTDNLDKARKQYTLYYKNKNLDYGRLGSYKVVEGVGSDGGGSFPDNYSKETEAVSIIHGDVERRGKWPIIGSMNNEIEPDKENHILYQSIRGIIGWPSANFGSLSLGSPCQMISAIIGLTGNPDMTITGKKFIEKRKECEGLKYLLDGNKHDMEFHYDGADKFDMTSFRNFFYATGISAGAGHNFIVLKCGPGISEILSNGAITVAAGNIVAAGAAAPYIQIGTRPVSTHNSTIILSHVPNQPNEKNIFYLNPQVANPFTIANTGMKNALIYMFSNQPDDQVMRKCRFGSIMLIYSMFYMYGMYIYNLYEKMIIDLKIDGDLKDKYKLANIKMRDSLLDYVNYMINKKFKITSLDTSKNLIISSTIEKTSRDKTNPNDADRIDTNNFIPNHSTTAPVQNYYRTELDPTQTKSAMDRVKLNELQGTIYIGFKDSNLYTNPDNFISDSDLFSKDNYPIVFSDYTTCDEIEFRETFKRLYEFLSIGEQDEEPKVDDK